MKCLGAFLFPVALLHPGTGWAVEARDCAQLADDKLRLACYDEIHKGPSPDFQGEGKWRVTRQVSKIDDSPEVYVAIEARDPLTGPEGRTSTGILMISCREGNTDMFLNFGDHVMSSKGTAGIVTTRVDKNRARKVQMTDSRDHKALGLWSGRRAVSFVKEMLGARTLFVRAFPPDEAAVDMEFEISGIDNAIAPLRDACDW